jgi:hypothetical protein
MQSVTRCSSHNYYMAAFSRCQYKRGKGRKGAHLCPQTQKEAGMTPPSNLQHG